MTDHPSAARVLEEVSRDHPGDHWYDVELGAVGRALAGASDDAWEEVERGVPGLSAAARRRLAEALLVPEDERATKLLIVLLRSPEPEVGAAVATTLLERGYLWDPAVDLGPDLRRHLAAAADGQREELERLLALVG
jgi:hypothetical protein